MRRWLISVLGVAVLAVLMASSAMATCFTDSAHTHAAALMDCGATQNVNTVDLWLDNWGPPANGAIIESETIESCTDHSLSQVGIIQGRICGIDGNPGGQWEFIEEIGPAGGCANDTITVVGPVTTASHHHLEVDYVANNPLGNTDIITDIPGPGGVRSYWGNVTPPRRWASWTEEVDAAAGVCGNTARGHMRNFNHAYTSWYYNPPYYWVNIINPGPSGYDAGIN